ncbi:hypothetical protein ASD56_07485 [Microbacterium sp. Root166]|nr:hypothetical protein ASD56_07485 [Microbacterium sp. Root166]
MQSIYMANPLPSYADWAKFDECFTAHAKELGIKGDTSGPTTLVPDNAFTVDRISQAITQGYDAIVMVPIEPAQFNPLMQRAKDAGIIIGTVNTGDATELQDFAVGTDYPAYGKQVAEEIGKLDGEQNVLLLTNGPGGVGDVILDSLKANAPENVTIVDTVFDGGDASQSADVVSRGLTAHPETTIVYSWEGTAVAGITTAIKEKDAVGKVFGVVNDLTDQSIAGIREGTLYGASKQNFCGMATQAIDYAVAVSKGEDVPALTDTGTTFVTEENLDAELDDK